MSRAFGVTSSLIGRYMCANSLVRSTQLRSAAIRSLSSTSSALQQTTTAKAEATDIGAYHNTSAMDKKLLVKAKMFPNIESCPDRVPLSRMNRARDQMRVRVNIWMMVGALVGCVFMIGFSRILRNQGHSIQKIEIARANDLREKHQESEASK